MNKVWAQRPNVNRELVQSSLIRSIGYDAELAVLELEFVDGDVYQYFVVQRSTYEELMQSPSKGQFFHARIDGQFGYRLVRP